MLNKLKNTVSNMIDTQKLAAQGPQKKIDVSILNVEEIKLYKKILDKFKENIQTIDQIGQNNKEELIQFIKMRAKQKQASGDQTKKQANQDQEGQQRFTFQEDINEIKDSLSDIEGQVKQIITFEQQIITKVNQLQQTSHVNQAQPPNQKNSQQLVTKYEAEIAALKKSQQNNKDILNTLSQQSQLYTKQVRELQQKCQKMEKEINQKNMLINNLKQEKIVLLQMRNSSTADQIPEFEALKGKLAEFEKRLNIERSKVQTKQKQIENLKKKMEQQHISLQKIADELKQKQLKSKRIIDKYERSKAQIRKFRQQKTQFIKQLNMEVAKLSQQLSQEKKKSQNFNDQIVKLKEQIDSLKSQVSKNDNRKIQLESSQAELVDVRKQLHEKNLFAEDQAAQIKKLKQQNDQLHQKRKQLLEALQKPINHEIRTLQKILKALDKLYKQYITTVFQDGNIVGFQARITYIISNIQEIKQDLLL